MNTIEIIELIRELYLGGDANIPITQETQLLETGICDSLGMVQLASSLESRIVGLRIDDQEITRDNFGSANAIHRFLNTKVN